MRDWNDVAAGCFRRVIRAGCLLVLLTARAAFSQSLDWPTWRGDAARSAATGHQLPDDLQLIWSRELGTPQPAWPESQYKIRFDASYDPVVAGKRIFIGSMVSDRVTAYDTETGAELWRFYAEAPVRFAPLVWRELVIFGSDDGRLYALNAVDGSVCWIKDAAPRKRWVIGNDRLVSMWPVRGAPALVEEPDGSARLYVAASIWPFMGTFIYALDPSTGKEIWCNSGSGSIYVLQQHNSPAFAGVAPQGYLAADGDFLLVSGGRTVPAAYDRHSGELKHFEVHVRVFGNYAGGYDVSIIGDKIYNNDCLYNLTDGAPIVKLTDQKQLGSGNVRRIGEGFVSVSKQEITWAENKFDTYEEEVVDRKGATNIVTRFKIGSPRLIAGALPAEKAHFRAGNHLYLSGKNGWAGAIDVTQPAGSNLVWETTVPGEIWSLNPGDNKLFAVLIDGTLLAFGRAATSGNQVRHEAVSGGVPDDTPIGGPEGYAMIWGLKNLPPGYLMQMAQRFHIIGADEDVELITSLRFALDEKGYYGRRVHLLASDPLALDLPRYLASLVEIRLPGDCAGKSAGRAWHVLRPYGGMAIYQRTEVAESGFFARMKAAFSRHRLTRAALEDFALQSATLRRDGARGRIDPGAGYARLDRAGSLPGSAPWTHENADPGNSVVSRDDLVKPPLGILWFGGPSNDDILPRHGHGPAPQIVGGRVFIEGPNALRAVDAYTGRLLWQRVFPGLGTFYDNTAHQPGANEIGSNYVSVEDGVYVVYKKQCHRLDPVTGDTLSVFDLPPASNGEKPHWGYLGIYDNLLVGGAEPVSVLARGDKKPSLEKNIPYSSSSSRLVAMDRYSGEVLWERGADQVFRHNAVALAVDRVFCIDGLSQTNLFLMQRRGEEPETPAKVISMDIRTGEKKWSSDADIFGTWLGYAADHGVLLESGSPARDRARDEARGRMTAYNAADGTVLWSRKISYTGRPMLHGDRIFTEGAAFSLLTGEQLKRVSPITGETMDWRFARNYGCNTPIGGQHMLLFRSAAAGFYDLTTDGGTGNWGGFKSGCTSNLMPADGILNAPDYTRTCTCSYQNQCSLALVSMPDVEIWTFQGFSSAKGPVKKLGINFGAPGDWPAPDGTLWLEYPIVGGRGPDMKVRISGKSTWFRHHSLFVSGEEGQVAASGLKGIVKVRIPLQTDGKESYLVRLVFLEPDTDNAGERVFDVLLQDETVLQGLDIVSETGGRMRSLVREFDNIEAAGELTVELRPAPEVRRLPVLSGIALYSRDSGD